MVRVPGSGPKNPPGETVPVIVPNVLGAVVLAIRHAVPVLPGHPAFGFAKWGVLVNPQASARTSNEYRSVILKWQSKNSPDFEIMGTVEARQGAIHTPKLRIRESDGTEVFVVRIIDRL